MPDVGSKSVLDTWRPLKELLTTKVPRPVAAFRPPASQAMLARVAATIGQRLPEDVRAFLALHDGEGSLHDRLPEGELIATLSRSVPLPISPAA